MKRKQKKEINTLKVMLKEREVILNSLGFTPEQILKDPFVIKMKIALKKCFDKPKKLYHPKLEKWQWAFIFIYSYNCIVFGIVVLIAILSER